MGLSSGFWRFNARFDVKEYGSGKELLQLLIYIAPECCRLASVNNRAICDTSQVQPGIAASLAIARSRSIPLRLTSSKSGVD